jgi:MoaA/NifB/PqqE/SkfB family radical SAM enzyme
MIPIEPQPSTLTLLPTYGCTAACANCCFGSHPGIAQRLSRAEMLDAIDQAAALGSVRLIVFSGGECFQLGDELVVAVARATEHRIATRWPASPPCTARGCAS